MLEHLESKIAESSPAPGMLRSLVRWFLAMGILARLALVASTVGVVGGVAYRIESTIHTAAGPEPAVGLYWQTNTDPTLAPGVVAPLWQLLWRTDSPSIYYKSGAAATAWTKVGDPAGGGGGISGTGTPPDLAVWTAAHAIGNFAGSSPAACAAGNAVSQVTSAATGALTLACTPITPGGSVSGTPGTYPVFTSTTAIGNSTFPISESSSTALAIGDSQSSDVITVSGRMTLTSAIAPNNAIGGAYNPVAGTTSGRGGIAGFNAGTFDTTAGAIANFGTLGQNTATKSAGGNTLTNYGTRGTASGSPDQNIGANGAASGTATNSYGVFGQNNSTGATNYGVHGEATAAGTTNIGGDFTATGAGTNTALRTIAGDVLLNNTSGTTGIGTAASTNNELTVLRNTSGSTASGIGESVTNSGTMNTTAGPLSATGGLWTVTKTRSAGANNLTNIGGEFNATGGQVNTALQTDSGNVILNSVSGNTTLTSVALGANASSAEIIGNAAASATAPTLIPNQASTTSGVGASASGAVSLIAAGSEFFRADSASTFNRAMHGIVGDAPNAFAARNISSSSTVPSLCPNSSDLTTGIGDDTAGDVSIIATGKEELRFTSADSLILEQANAAISGSVAGGFAIKNQASSSTIPAFIPNRSSSTSGIGADAAGDVSIIESGVEAIRVAATISVNLSMLNPLSGSWQMRNAAAGATSPTFVPNNTDTTTGIGASSAGTISFIAATTEAMRVTSTGTVGIITFAMNAPLKLQQSTGRIQDARTAPTLSAGCGTGATVTAGWSFFSVTTNATAIGTCTITLNSPASSNTSCDCEDRAASPTTKPSRTCPLAAGNTLVLGPTGLIGGDTYDCWVVDH